MNLGSLTNTIETKNYSLEVQQDGLLFFLLRRQHLWELLQIESLVLDLDERLDDTAISSMEYFVLKIH